MHKDTSKDGFGGKELGNCGVLLYVVGVFTPYESTEKNIWENSCADLLKVNERV